MGLGLARQFAGWLGLSEAKRDALTAEESARQLNYLIRHHYACSDASADGKTRTPLYYASIEGICGNSLQTVALLKGLPVEDPPVDYQMIDLFNYVPKAVRTDVSCLMNGFSFDRVEVKVGGKVNDKLAELGKRLLRESEAKKSWSLRSMLFRGASQGDAFIRVRPSSDYATGVQFDLAHAEAVFPRYSAWNQRKAEAYRTIFSVLRGEVPANVQVMSAGSALRDVYVEIVDREGIQVYKNDEPVDEDEDGNPVSGLNPEGLDEPAMVHLAYRDSGDFEGIPAVDADTIALIDEGNVEAANLRQASMSFGRPNLFLFGASQQDGEKFRWGQRGVHGLPTDGKAELLHFEGLANQMEIVESYGPRIRDRIVQFVIDDVRNGNAAESGIALQYRLFPYDSYLGDVELQAGGAMADMLRIAFKILGVWPKDGEVEITVGWGPRFPVDIEARLAQAKSRIETFGRIPVVVEREAREEGYDTKETQAIVDHIGETNRLEAEAKETAAQGGGLFGAARAEQQRQQRQQATNGEG